MPRIWAKIREHRQIRIVGFIRMNDYPNPCLLRIVESFAVNTD